MGRYRRALLSLSGLQLAAVCPGSAVLPRVGSTSVKADIGSALHEYNALRGEKGREAADEQGDEIADRLGLDGKDRAIFFARARALDLQIPEGALYEVPLCLRADGTVEPVTGGRGEYMVPEDALVAGTLDILFSDPEPLLDGQWCPPGSVLWTPDLKTGSDAYVAPIQRNWQARVSALLGAKWTRAAAVVPAIVYPHAAGGTWDIPQRNGDPVALRADDLARIEADVRTLHAAVTEQERRLAEGKPLRLVTGAHCTYCPARRGCPAHVAETRALVTGQAGLVAGPLTPEQAARGAAMLGPAKAATEALEEALRAHVEAYGPIPLPDGKVYGPVPATRTTYRTRLAYAALRQELDAVVGEEEGERLADEAFRTSEKAIKDAIRAAHEIAGLKKKQAEALRRIKAVEGVTHDVPSLTWSAHYPRETNDV